MEKYDIYSDISTRTGGDVYIGVVGPVRTGKSTFITKFMNNFVIPNMAEGLERKIATDEMPQSADGKTVMTTQPKFVPANAVKVQFKNKTTAKFKLIDCVGYLIKGAMGSEEDEKPRKVKTPWSEEEMPFTKAAELGTAKVIKEYSTIGILVTTDGSIGEIPRENYIPAEEKVVKELKEGKKPFVIVLNSANPDAENTLKLTAELEEKYGVSVIAVSCLNMTAEDISGVMEKLLLEFPVCGINVDIPEWMRALPSDSCFIKEIADEIKSKSANMIKMRDFIVSGSFFSESENFNTATLDELNMGNGMPKFSLTAKEGLFYKVLSDECGEEIKDDYALMHYIKEFSDCRKHYLKIKDALKDADEEGYGVVIPTVDEMNLEDPVVVKTGGRYGVKLKASAPCLHIMKIDVNSEVSPIVGTMKQGEDLVNYINEKYEDNPSGIWDTDMFGKSLHELVADDLKSKVSAMPKDVQVKMRKTMSRIVNESRGGVICILL